MMTALRPRHRTMLDVVWITPQETCAPSAITHDSTMAPVTAGSRQTLSKRVMRLPVTREIARPARDVTASTSAHGSTSP